MLLLDNNLNDSYNCILTSYQKMIDLDISIDRYENMSCFQTKNKHFKFIGSFHTIHTILSMTNKELEKD